MGPDGVERMTVLMHVRTGDQTADTFTKALTGPAFAEYRGRSLGEEPKSSSAMSEDHQIEKRRRR